MCGALLWAAAAASCAGDRRPAIVSKRGVADATALAQRANQLTRLQLESYLLGVRATERDYRAAGRDDVADAYVEAFETTLAHCSDSLAALILGPEAARARRAAPPILIAAGSAPAAAPAPAEPTAEPSPADSVCPSPGLQPAIEEASPWELDIK